MYKIAWCTYKVVVCWYKHVIFCRSPCRRRRRRRRRRCWFCCHPDSATIVTWRQTSPLYSSKIFGNFGSKVNGSVRSNRKSFEKTGPHFEVEHFSRSDRLEFWLNGSRLLVFKRRQKNLQIARTFKVLSPSSKRSFRNTFLCKFSTW